MGQEKPNVLRNCLIFFFVIMDTGPAEGKPIYTVDTVRTNCKTIGRQQL